MAINTAENAALYYEAGQSYQAMTALTDSGDATTFTSGASLWSDKSGYGPTVRPNGLVSGGAVTVGAGNNNVAVASLTCYLAGTLTTVEADATNAITRATTNTYSIINSITVTSAGALAVVVGTEGAALSDTRGAAGGPPWIPTGSIEIAQIRLTDDDDAVITSAEIFSVVGTHTERSDFPVWDEQYESGSVEFVDALSKIHSDDAGSTTAAKKVYAEYYSPIFADVGTVTDFVPPETSYSITSTSVYGGAIGASSSALGQGSFTAYLSDGITDNVVTQKGQKLWFKFLPDRLKTPYLLCQGVLGVTRSFPAGDNIQASCTISSSVEAQEVTS